MYNQPEIQDSHEEPSLQSVKSELNALKRRFARLQKENDNVTHLYKQAASLRDFNEKEKETQMRYNQLLRDNSPDDILLLDTELNILLCTSSVKNAFGRDVTGESFLPITEERFGEKYAKEVETALFRMLNNFKISSMFTNSYELNIEVGGEQRSFYSITLSPALDNAGELIGVVVLAHDNTEMHEANIRAEEANKAKSAFLSTMSHEIRTPMNAILGITEIQLGNDKLDESVREALGKIYASGDMLLGIINDILDLSKIEAGKLELLPARYEVASLISDTAQLNIMRIGEKPIEFELDADEEVPAFLMGDELRVKQILNNILSNAFKYTAEGTVTLSIASEKADDSGESVRLVVSVSDTGQGMSKEQVARLFDEYSRFNAEANRSTEGTGLGMSITRNLIRLMDGEIFIESEPGKGSTFTVYLPQGIIDDKKLGKEVADNLRQFRSSSRADMKRVQISRDPMPYGRVLIVDDVETNIYVARGLMAPYELKIDAADSGFAAIEKIENGEVYDIIFMDHMMPKMDGIEATGIIRGKGYEHPIVALTANAVAGQAEVFLGNGFDDFISKPIDVRQLNTVLNRLIRDKQTAEVLEAAKKNENTNNRTEGVPEPPVLDPKFAEIFVRDAQKALATLRIIAGKNSYSEEENLRAYIINVHGMKSALANIGNSGLSGEALRLEMAGREGKIEIITAETELFLDKLQEYVEEITPQNDPRDDEIIDENIPYLNEVLMRIKSACEEYDGNDADEALAELEKMSWSGQTKELLKEISEKLLYSDFDEIADIISERVTNA